MPLLFRGLTRGLRRRCCRPTVACWMFAVTALVHVDASAGQCPPGVCPDDAGAWWRTSPDRESHGSAEHGGISWRLVASSDVIVRATLSVSDEASAALQRRDHEFLSIPLTVSEILKGDPPHHPVVLTYDAGDSHGGPEPKDILRATGKAAVLFLATTSEARPDYFFARWESDSLIPEATDEETRNAKEMVNEVAARIGRTREYLANNNLPRDAEVARLIESVIVPESAGDALCRLLLLGPEGVPALIRRMDDRRRIALPHVSLFAPPDYFEALVHYKPETVVDLVSVVLSYAVGESFGFIANGGSESKRRKVVDGWYAWLGDKMQL